MIVCERWRHFLRRGRKLPVQQTDVGRLSNGALSCQYLENILVHAMTMVDDNIACGLLARSGSKSVMIFRYVT